MSAKKIKREDFPGNSKSSRIAPMRPMPPEDILGEEGTIVPAEQERKPERRRVRAIQRKRSFTQSIAEALVGDRENNVGGYILHDVLLPAAKNTIQEMVTSGIEMLLFGETRDRGRSRSRDRGDKSIVSYGSYYKQGREDRRERQFRRDRFGLSDIYFKNSSDAEGVLEELCDRLEEYEQVTVDDYFELAGLESSWIHNKWGWENLKRAYCTHTRHGWVVVLPDPIELD